MKEQVDRRLQFHALLKSAVIRPRDLSTPWECRPAAPFRGPRGRVLGVAEWAHLPFQHRRTTINAQAMQIEVTAKQGLEYSKCLTDAGEAAAQALFCVSWLSRQLRCLRPMIRFFLRIERRCKYSGPAFPL